ncbi:protein of unknown function [Clostridium beijerinckii]|nr:protein of unknown function [Clostridium beijerinckii]
MNLGIFKKAERDSGYFINLIVFYADKLTNTKNQYLLNYLPKNYTVISDLLFCFRYLLQMN